MSLRALKSFVVVLSLVACANEMQEIGGPEDNSGGTGSGASGGEAASGGTGSGSTGGTGSGSGSGSTGGTSSTGSGGKGGTSGAFGGSAGVTGSGGSSGGSAGSTGGGGTSGGSGGASGGAGGASGSGGSGGSGTPTGECATMTEWVAGKQLTAAMAKGDELTYNDKVFTYAGDMPLWNFEAKCPPEGTREAWCDQSSSIYKYTLVGPCE